MPVKKVFKAVVKRVRTGKNPVGSPYTRYFKSAGDKSSTLERYRYYTSMELSARRQQVKNLTATAKRKIAVSSAKRETQKVIKIGQERSRRSLKKAVKEMSKLSK